MNERTKRTISSRVEPSFSNHKKKIHPHAPSCCESKNSSQTHSLTHKQAVHPKHNHGIITERQERRALLRRDQGPAAQAAPRPRQPQGPHSAAQQVSQLSGRQWQWHWRCTLLLTTNGCVCLFVYELWNISEWSEVWKEPPLLLDQIPYNDEHLP